MAAEGDQLSEREFQIIKDTWGNVEKRLKLDGNRIFIRLFEQHPEYRRFFPDFGHLSHEEMIESERLRLHVVRVTSALNILIYSANHHDALHRACGAIVNSHHFRGVRHAEFQHFADEFCEYIHYVVRIPEARDAWRKTMHLLVHGLSYDDQHLQLY